MKIVGELLKLAGKEDFKIDEKIGFGYIVRICWRYGWMLIRGIFFSMGYSNISNKVFIGKNVRVYQKKSLAIGSQTKIRDNVKIDALARLGVSIGDRVVLGENTIIECTGALSFVGKGVVIGDRTSFGRNCFFGAAGGIEVGSDVIAGEFVRFHSENHIFNDKEMLIKDQGVSHQGIKIGNNCWIGAGAVFLDGAEIGNGCVVAANAVVNKKFGDNSVVGGVPAKVLKVR